MWKFFFFSLAVVVLISCSQVENTVDLENCDFAICESARNNLDTLFNVYGMLLEENNQTYIEVTGNGFEPHRHYISCLEEQVVIPVAGTYVQFSAYVKDACNTENSITVDSLSLFEMQEIDPFIQEFCENEILMEGFDIDQNDEKLKIHHLTVEDDCLSVLVSYTGSCDQMPALSLHNGGDLLFGDVQVVVSLQGPIINDCTQEQNAVLQFNLTPLRDSLSGLAIQKITLYFLSQGLLRVQYPFAE